VAGGRNSLLPPAGRGIELNNVTAVSAQIEELAALGSDEPEAHTPYSCGSVSLASSYDPVGGFESGPYPR
jgi:hypothetical protein